MLKEVSKMGVVFSEGRGLRGVMVFLLRKGFGVKVFGVLYLKKIGYV